VSIYRIGGVMKIVDEKKVEVNAEEIVEAINNKDCPSSISLDLDEDCTLCCKECWANVLKAIKVQ